LIPSPLFSQKAFSSTFGRLSENKKFLFILLLSRNEAVALRFFLCGLSGSEDDKIFQDSLI
jgi:hypothetical protein